MFPEIPRHGGLKELLKHRFILPHCSMNIFLRYTLSYFTDLLLSLNGEHGSPEDKEEHISSRSRYKCEAFITRFDGQPLASHATPTGAREYFRLRLINTNITHFCRAEAK